MSCKSMEAHFFGSKINLLTMRETLAHIDSRLCQHVFTQHVVVNVAKIVHMQADKELAASVQACDIVNVDGMGVVWGARFLGIAVPERVSGADLFDELLALSAQRGYPVYLLGATEEVVHRTADLVRERHASLDVVGFHNGYFWNNEEAIVNEIKASGARLLFVAITSPKKENFINKWQDRLGVDFVMGVGGTFDVVAGKVKRAPLWMQKYGLEWFYRVIQEPGRMWRRYLTTNLIFSWMLILAKIRQILGLCPY
jgi:N-acetylglucosaminyldiphosphoundecaprenol N-acetyl-beta-D-mannosaminyltransferase